jgi:hypothetical protein
MGPRNAYKDMLDKVVSPIACVNMNHQNQLEQMANGAMFATISPFLVIYDNTSKASINLQKLTKLKLLTCLPSSKLLLGQHSPFLIFSSYVDILPLWSHILGTTTNSLLTLAWMLTIIQTPPRCRCFRPANLPRGYPR